MVILFADLRSFTRFAERTLPYDVVFIINQYFRHMGEAIEKAGGRVDKFIGDGVMALFGLNDPPEVACRRALDAAAGMAAALEEMNASLESDLPEPFRIGIGLHVGHVIVGEMGYGRTVSVTAIGDAVNTASRLEALNKDYGSQLIFSQRVAELAALPTEGLRSESVMIRGRQSALDVLVVDDAAHLARAAEASVTPA
jgi:adenylate cyclase